MTADPLATSVGERDEAIRMVEGEFMNMVGRLRRLIARRADRLSPGLLPGGFKVFTMIALDGPLTASAVGEQLLLDKSQMSRMVSTLEERNLVVRTPDPNDRRAQLLEATPEAKARLDEIHGDPSERSLKHKLSHWNVDDIQRLADLLHALNEDEDAAED
ncbi:MarR family winged helix-turn-helix transcriptional regulator [Microbacterium halotolerans]|uniref:MarR family winged helix-turn-helix transcriptional regulator n=1 Tax=Microbacterium halotolerans TaxID=246613 RepID=UPI000E6A9F86|nr:MarR family winged helix-turn-helix transcriptional regulator [Microbacterium halotolerans]